MRGIGVFLLWAVVMGAGRGWACSSSGRGQLEEKVAPAMDAQGAPELMRGLTPVTASLSPASPAFALLDSALKNYN
jgi:hypothetical protein